MVFIINVIASGIVGSYIIDVEDYQKQLLFTRPPYNKDDISILDKYIYAAKISANPYYAIISLIFTITVIVIKFKKSKKIQ